MIGMNHIKTFGKNWVLAWAGLLKWSGKWGGMIAAISAGMVAVGAFFTLPAFVWLWYRYGDLNPPGVETAPPEVYAAMVLWMVFWLVVVVAAQKTRREINGNRETASR